MMSSVPALGNLNILNSPSHSNFQHSPAWSTGPWAKASTFLAVAAVASVAVLLEEVAASEVAPGVVALLVAVLVVEQEVAAKTPLLVVAVVVLRLWKRRFQVSLARTILSSPRCLTPRSFVTVRLTVAITPT